MRITNTKHANKQIRDYDHILDFYSTVGANAPKSGHYFFVKIQGLLRK